MRDFYTKDNMHGQLFHVPGPGLVFEPDHLSFETETGTGREGVIRVRHRGGQPAKGCVYPSERSMRGTREQFAAAADGTGLIRWQFDARGLAPGRTVRGFFRVISPYGEYLIPYTAEISGRGEVQRRTGITGHRTSMRPEDPTAEEALPQPRICSKEDFAALADKDFSQAAAFFYSRSFSKILKTDEDRTIYRGLSMEEGNLHNVEEFLIAACGKEKTVFMPVEKELFAKCGAGRGRVRGRIAGTRAERALEAHRQRVRSRQEAMDVSSQNEGIREEERIYIPLRIRRIGRCALDAQILTGARFFPEAVIPVRMPGTDREMEETVVQIPVDRSALHAGRNFGQITLRGPFQEISVPTEVYCERSVSPVRIRQERELEIMQLQLMRLYVDLCLGLEPVDMITEQAKRLIDDISMRTHRDLIPRLYGVHLLILRGMNAEAQKELARIVVRYAGEESAQNFTARFSGEHELAYGYRLFLFARSRMEDSQTRGRVSRYLRGIYRQSGDWRFAFMLMDLSEEYLPGSAARWNFLRHQYENGCSSPVIWTAAWEMVRDDPQILLPGSSVQERWARDDFGLHVLWYAARNRVLTPRTVEMMTEFAEKKKTFPPLLYKALCTAFEVWDPEDTAVRRDILRAICMLLVRGQDLSARARRWYAAARDAGVSLTRLEENLQQSAPEGDTDYRRPSGYNAILRTTSRRAVRAVLVYDCFRQEQSFPIRDGVAVLPVYGEANTIFLEDAEGNRYASSLPYALDIDGPESGDLRTTEEADPAKGHDLPLPEDPCRLAAWLGLGTRENAGLADLPPDLLSEAAGRLLDSGQLTAAGRTRLLLPCLERCRENMQEQDITGASDICKDPDRAGSPALLNAPPEDRKRAAAAFRFLLKKADPAQCTPEERARLLSFLEEAGEYDTALQWLMTYGTEEIDAALLGRICLGLSGESARQNALLTIGWDAFTRGNRDSVLLESLAGMFPGLSRELTALHDACAEAGVSTKALDSRIVHQVLYSAAITPEHAKIIVAAKNALGEDLLPAAAQYADYSFSEGVRMGSRMTELIADLILQADAARAGEGSADRHDAAGSPEGQRPPGSAALAFTPLDSCRIAFLREISAREKAVSGREKEASRLALSALLSAGVVFPFFRQFAGLDDRLDLYAEETLVEYHPARTDSGAGRHVVFHYTSTQNRDAGSYQSRLMKEMYRGFYVSGFLLFYGEKMHYYITEDKEEKHVVQSGIIGQDARIHGSSAGRFGLINQATRAASMRENDEALSLLTAYYRRNYLEGELFRG